jgi:P4 family phage/plasmid primase-like protien
VVDLPVLDAAGAVVGHVLYNASGGTLPKYDRTGKIAGQLKVKNTAGTAPGLIGRLPTAETKTIVKVEGPSDALALLSCPDLPADVAVVTNAMGAGERPAPWMLELAAGRQVLAIGDADRPGDQGAAVWAAAFAGHADEACQVRLPYDVTETHGRDLRDWLAEGHGWADLLDLAAKSPIVESSADDPSAENSAVLEADDDPHRLARVNMRRYAELTGGRTIKYWRSEWYVWKDNRYRKIQEDEFRAKVSFAIKEEFNRLNIEAQERFRRGQDAGLIAADEDPPKARKVTPSLISSVMQATSSMVSISGDIDVGTWLPTRERRNWISFRNGLLDIDALLADKEMAECFRPNSPEWFSTISIPYDFDPEAGCPFFEDVIEHNLDMDPEKVKILQEWAGYVLTPDTGEQKFLILEGEGSNGKSVYVAAITAMLGEDNVSTVPLEVFGERFARAETLGKLLNAAADCGELDKVAEGYLKPFTSGDRMFFDRKGVPGLNCRPTARLMVAVNTRPRFSDRSRGIWRRMKLIKFDVEITREKRIKGLDKIEYWERSGELPGILNWALRGLARLRAQNGFTESESENQEIEDYKEEVNPARAFLSEYVEETTSGKIATKFLYGWYKKWAAENGYHPLSERVFGKEVKRKFPKMDRRKGGTRESRNWEYFGIQFSQEEIEGEKITDARLF